MKVNVPPAQGGYLTVTEVQDEIAYMKNAHFPETIDRLGEFVNIHKKRLLEKYPQLKDGQANFLVMVVVNDYYKGRL